MKPIEITYETGGRLVYAVPKTEYGTSDSSWLVIISCVIPDGDNDLMIIRHASYSFSTGITYIDCKGDTKWGLTRNYDFYEPNDEHIELMKKILKETGYKYVKGINKMFKR